MTGQATRQKEVLAALEGRECLTTEEIAARTALPRRAVVNGAACLISRGYLERAEVGCYRLTDSGREARATGVSLTSGPNGKLTQARPRERRRTFRDRLWAAMRLKAKFTIGDLLDVARAPGEDGYDNARRYLRSLEAAGVVNRLARRAPGIALTSNGYAKFLLIRDLGPAAPIIREGGAWDRNAGGFIETGAAP